MVYKVLRWLLRIAASLILLLAIALGAMYYYVNANRDRMIREAGQAAGLEISYQSLKFGLWRDFPRVSLTIDSLVVRDTLLSRQEPPLIHLKTIRAEASLATLLRDTVKLKCIEMSHGDLHIERDIDGRYNLGSIFTVKPGADTSGTSSSLIPVFDWRDLQVEFNDLSIYHCDPVKNRLMELHVDEVFGYGERAENGDLVLNADLNLDVSGIALNAEKGSYLTDTRVSGPVKVRFGGEVVTISPTRLQFGPQEFTFAAEFSRNTKGKGVVRISSEAVDYDLTRPLLHGGLREKLTEYHVSGTFPVAAAIELLPEEPHEPLIELAFQLNGQKVKLKQYHFTDVHTSGKVVNRLTVAEGGIAGSRKNLRITLDSTSGYLGRMLVQAPHARVASIAGDSRLTAPLRLSGPSESLSRWLKTQDFFFRNGQFTLTTEVDAWLSSEDEIVASSDGQLHLWNTNVMYQPTGVNFPFASIVLDKTGDDVGFRINSRPLTTGFTFQLTGNIDNLTPLLLDRPGEALNTNVSLRAPRINWTDFLSLFGEDGLFTEEEETGAVAGAGKVVAQANGQQESMRKTLLGLKQAFHPTIDVRFDTVAYYDVFSVTDFRTGLHFTGDTLVLERTTFNWAGSQLGLDARLALNHPRQTPFDLAARAEHLNLNRLRPALNYFGLKLPAELDSLPDDLSIDFVHLGRLDDSIGVVAGYNTGSLVFDDGRNQLFSGQMEYAPGPGGLATHLRLAGDPQIVNVLFGAENFFFGTGHFDLDLRIDGSPEDLSALVRAGKLKLRIDSSRIAYPSAGVFVPLQSFAVDFHDNRASFLLHLLSDTTRAQVKIEGSLNQITAFLYPERGHSFSVSADLNAPMLNWSDFKGFFLPDTSLTTVADAPSFDPQSVFSATEGIFRSFRPDLKLKVDTFQLAGRPSITNIFSRLSLQDSVGLVLDRSGFDLGEGTVRFNALYALDEQKNSPFSLDVDVDSIELEDLLAEFSRMGLAVPADPGLLRGKVTLHGALRGRLDEGNQHLVPDSTQGEFRYLLHDLELAESPKISGIGKKVKMAKRFEHLRFAPLAGTISLDSSLAHFPRSEVQSTGFQVFIEGDYDLEQGPDLLISLPLRNIGRGLLKLPPPPTGYARSGWKVYLVAEPGKDGEPKMKFRLGRRKYFKDRGRLEEFKAEKMRLKAERKKRN